MKKLTKKINQNIYRKHKFLIFLIILLLIVLASQGCSETKYEITIRKTLEREDYSNFFEEDAGELSEKSPIIINEYRARTIIRSTDTSIWFIDDNGSFQFIKADEIQVIKID